MVAIIKGDVISSRKIQNQDIWLMPLRELLSTWGKTPQDWELVWGDFFQIEIENPMKALSHALEIKILVKKITDQIQSRNLSPVDIRLAIGLGEKTYAGRRISESNGPAYIHAGEKFEKLKKEKVNLAIKSPWKEFDQDMNLYLKLAGIFMDNWTTSSAELMEIVWKNPGITQEEIGQKLGIKQNSVSGRWNRAHVDEVFELELMYRQKLQKLLP